MESIERGGQVYKNLAKWTGVMDGYYVDTEAARLLHDGQIALFFNTTGVPATGLVEAALSAIA